MGDLEAWRRFGSLLHQDFLVFHPDFWSGVRLIFQDMSDRDRQELLAFLGGVEQAGPDELVRLWDSSGAGVWLPVMEMPRHFTLLASELRAAIARDPNRRR